MHMWSTSMSDCFMVSGIGGSALTSGMALVVGMQVGSGIFSSPGVVVASVGSTGASLLVWFVSGLLAWTGARYDEGLASANNSSFAELGCAIPLSGGAQAYLAYSVCWTC